jgi:hypothetical protein
MTEIGQTIVARLTRTATMLPKPTSKRTRPKPKAVLRLPDLDQAKSAVLNSLASADSQRRYRHAIDEFVEWYCSEPRLSFSRTVVMRYRLHLESRHSLQGQSIFAWVPCVAWHMRPPIVGSSALLEIGGTCEAQRASQVPRPDHVRTSPRNRHRF